MRVSTKALAPLPLLFFASCVTPPPMHGAGRPVAHGTGRPFEQSESRRDRGNEHRFDDRRFDDGRYGLRSSGDGRLTSMSAAYEPAVRAAGAQRRRESGHYDRGYTDPVPPHERGDYSGRSNGRVSFLFGGRNLDDDAVLAADQLYSFGVDFAQAVQPGDLGFEFGFHYAGKEDNNVGLPASANFNGGVFNVERDMVELSAGVRAEFSRSNVRPYIGGGGTLINMSEQRSQGFLRADDNDSTIGLYLHGGVQFDLNEAFFLGVDFRRVFGSEVTLFDDTYDTDYSQLSFVLGMTL